MLDDGAANAAGRGGDGGGSGGGISYRMKSRSNCLRILEPTDGIGICSRTACRQRAHKEAIKQGTRQTGRSHDRSGLADGEMSARVVRALYGGRTADETRTSFDLPVRPVVLIVGGRETRGALWERDPKRGLELAQLGKLLPVGLSPERLAVVDEQAGVGAPEAGLARLVCAHRDGDGLCLDGLEVLVKAGADDALYADGGEAEEACEGKVACPCVAPSGGEGELDHGGGRSPAAAWVVQKRGAVEEGGLGFMWVLEDAIASSVASIGMEAPKYFDC